jgi:hypothetical protein
MDALARLDSRLSLVIDQRRGILAAYITSPAR